MRFQLLAPLFFLFFLALGDVKDTDQISNLIESFGFLADALDLASLDRLFFTDATFDAGDGNGPVQGIPAINALIREIEFPGTFRRSQTTSKLVQLNPPFSGLGLATNANATTYVTVKYFGEGAQRGRATSFFAEFHDTFVRTGDFYTPGGWKFNTRVFNLYVSYIPFPIPISGQIKLLMLLLIHHSLSSFSPSISFVLDG